ncbi:hypothetical protein Purlil1_11173 [Purpureocillium lilacinum]|uniref:Metalloprotease 1 n=1 Tax=Purpureocillium lilacinum TaxID=33203 RepID=A0ABR0BKH3_PURLI|nr:hypothetical protein Purlil1_11173 [Purpureocillium lilacinum]
MERLLLILLVSAATAPLAAGVGRRPNTGQLCKSPDIPYEPSKLWKRADPPADDGRELVVEMFVHTCCEQEKECPTEADIRLTVDTLNGYFARAKIRFDLQKAMRHRECGLDGAKSDQKYIDRLMGKVRQGGLGTYNLLIRPGDDGESSAGACRTQPPGTDISTVIGGLDGCNAGDYRIDRAGTGSGNSSRRGDHLVAHETGHWLGLKHTFPISQAPEEWANFMEPAIPAGTKYYWSCDQIRVARQWCIIRLRGQEDGFGVNHDVADPPPRGPDGTFCPGTGPGRGTGLADGKFFGEDDDMLASGNPPGGPGCKNPKIKIPAPPDGYGSWCEIPEEAWGNFLTDGESPSHGRPPPVPSGGQQGIPGGSPPPAPGGGQDEVPGGNLPPEPGGEQQGVPWQDGQNGLYRRSDPNKAGREGSKRTA